MSLLTTASVWVDTPKKRTPTIRKTIKKPAVNESENYSPFSTITEKFNQYENDENENNNQINHNGDEISPLQKHQENQKNQENQENQEIKNDKVNILLDKMNSINSQSDGSGLYDYKPPPPTSFISHKPPPPTQLRQKENFQNSDATPSVDYTSSTSTIPLSHPLFLPNTHSNQSVFSSSNYLQDSNITNYRQAYEKPLTTTVNYTNMGIHPQSNFENKIMDRIQYLTHLMEEMQNEKTANVTEEFVLYTMLGVFVIYVVDSFTRVGKYTR